MAGRPTSYKEEYNEQAYKLCLLGYDSYKISYFFDITIHELAEWICNYPSLFSSMVKGDEDRSDFLNRAELKKQKRRNYLKAPKQREVTNKYIALRHINNPKVKLKARFASLLRQRLLTKNYQKTFEIVGYSVSELILHLESKFTEGMNWDNYGKVWHVDHIKPDCLFNYTTKDDEDFKKCWDLSNLQPLFALENLRKGKKYVCAAK